MKKKMGGGEENAEEEETFSYSHSSLHRTSSMIALTRTRIAVVSLFICFIWLDPNPTYGIETKFEQKATFFSSAYTCSATQNDIHEN